MLQVASLLVASLFPCGEQGKPEPALGARRGRVQNAAGVIMAEPDESRSLADPTESELETAFAENLFELFRSMALLPGAELEESDHGSRHRAFPFSPMFTGLWRPPAP